MKPILQLNPYYRTEVVRVYGTPYFYLCEHTCDKKYKLHVLHSADPTVYITKVIPKFCSHNGVFGDCIAFFLPNKVYQFDMRLNKFASKPVDNLCDEWHFAHQCGPHVYLQKGHQLRKVVWDPMRNQYIPEHAPAIRFKSYVYCDPFYEWKKLYVKGKFYEGPLYHVIGTIENNKGRNVDYHYFYDCNSMKTIHEGVKSSFLIRCRDIPDYVDQAKVKTVSGLFTRVKSESIQFNNGHTFAYLENTGVLYAFGRELSDARTWFDRHKQMSHDLKVWKVREETKKRRSESDLAEQAFKRARTKYEAAMRKQQEVEEMI